MAQLIEAQGNAFFTKCKGYAVLITALTGLVLGVLNWFKEVRDPRVKVSYQELAKQVEAVSSDLQRLAGALRTQAEEVSTIQNWVISERDRKGAEPGPVAKKIMKTAKAAKEAKPAPAPPPRKPATWEQVQTQVPKGI